MTAQRPRTHASPPEWLRAGDAPALSVIVPTRNEVGNIRPLLARLDDALGGIDAEVVVVDDSFDARQSGASKAGIKEGLTYLRRLATFRTQARRAPQRPRRQLARAACGTGADRPSVGPEVTAASGGPGRKDTSSRL